MPFAKLKLNELILKALQDEGYETPTAIQSKAIPPILEGKDLLGCAQTGTGKTAAFALPIIHRLTETVPHDAAHPAVAPRSGKSPRALILSPTRELAAQIGESFAAYGRHAGLRGAVIFGGVSQMHQERTLARGVDVIVATPGRLIDLMEQGVVDLSKIAIFVLDEADRMLDMGFIQPIRRIAAAVPKQRQTLLFSATMPKEIQHLADSLLRDPVKVAVHAVASAAPKIDQRLYHTHMRQKAALLERLLKDSTVERALVFTKTKHGADRVCKRLNHDGLPSVAIHGNKAQNYRTRALDAFRSGKVKVLVATDVAARGLDVDNITHVFNYDLPMEPEAYVHRIGRTGRAGASGVAISFCDGSERDLLRYIQKLIGTNIPVVNVPNDLPLADHAHPRQHTGGGGSGGGFAAAHSGGGDPDQEQQPQHQYPPRRQTQRQRPQGGSPRGERTFGGGGGSGPGGGGGPGAGRGGPKRGFARRGAPVGDGQSGQPGQFGPRRGKGERPAHHADGPGPDGASRPARPRSSGHSGGHSGGHAGGGQGGGGGGHQGGPSHGGGKKPQVRVFGPRKSAKPGKRW